MVPQDRAQGANLCVDLQTGESFALPFDLKGGNIASCDVADEPVPEVTTQFRNVLGGSTEAQEGTRLLLRAIAPGVRDVTRSLPCFTQGEEKEPRRPNSGPTRIWCSQV